MVQRLLDDRGLKTQLGHPATEKLALLTLLTQGTCFELGTDDAASSAFLMLCSKYSAILTISDHMATSLSLHLFVRKRGSIRLALSK